MAFDQRQRTLRQKKRPSVGLDVPHWLQEWLIDVGKEIDKIPRYLNTMVAIGPNTSATSWVVSHMLNNPNPVVQIRYASTGTVIYPDVQITDSNTITMTSTASMIPDSFVMTILG